MDKPYITIEWVKLGDIWKSKSTGQVGTNNYLGKNQAKREKKVQSKKLPHTISNRHFMTSEQFSKWAHKRWLIANNRIK